MDRQALERDLFFQRKALLRPLFKCLTVDDKCTEDPRNFPNASGVITLIKNTRGNLKAWNHLAGAKNAYPNIRMTQIESLTLKKMS